MMAITVKILEKRISAPPSSSMRTTVCMYSTL